MAKLMKPNIKLSDVYSELEREVVEAKKMVIIDVSSGGSDGTIDIASFDIEIGELLDIYFSALILQYDSIINIDILDSSKEYCIYVDVTDEFELRPYQLAIGVNKVTPDNFPLLKKKLIIGSDEFTLIDTYLDNLSKEGNVILADSIR